MASDRIKTYYSGVSKVFLSILFGIGLVAILPDIIHGTSLTRVLKTSIIVSTILLFLIYLIFNTRYTISPKYLMIKVGIFNYKPILIRTIYQINKTKSLVSGPASSFDRLEIRYNKFDSIVVSPKDKEAFINHLIEINPKIRVSI